MENTTEEYINRLEAFQKKLQTAPPKEEIQINSMAGNSRYLPISFVQMKLDEIFMGLWECEISHTQVVANEVIGYGVLKVFHPIAQVWLSRSGSASAVIQQRSEKDAQGNKIQTDITDVSKKIQNTLVKDFPHLESEIIKSGAKKFGKIFGRDLNRKFEDKYNSIYSDEIFITSEMSRVSEQLLNVSTLDELGMFWDKETDLQSNVDFKKLMSAKKGEIKEAEAKAQKSIADGSK